MNVMLSDVASSRPSPRSSFWGSLMLSPKRAASITRKPPATRGSCARGLGRGRPAPHPEIAGNPLPEFAMIAIGLAITAATVAFWLRIFSRARRRRISRARVARNRHAGVRGMSLFRRNRAGGHIFHADRLERVHSDRRRRRSCAYRSLAAARRAEITLAQMAVLSIPLWLIFEAYNFAARKLDLCWSAARMGGSPFLGYAWSFATITPAVFETADLVQGPAARGADRAVEDFRRPRKRGDDCRRGVSDRPACAARHRGLLFRAGRGRIVLCCSIR